MQSKTKKIVLAALLASLTCVATMVKVPTPPIGYINLGDCVVLLAGWLLSPLYAFFAAGVGSALADVFSGYILYAPATFFIKGFMALIAYFLSRKSKKLPFLIVSGFIAEVVMIAGYYIFEGFIYGFIPSAVNIPLNAVQGATGLILGILLVRIFDKSNIVN